MNDDEIIQWMVRRINNDRYRDYLGPLTKYRQPADILPHIMAASTYIKDPEIIARKKFVANDNQNGRTFERKHFNGSRLTNDNKAMTCFRYSSEGHLSRNCPQKRSVVCFRCSKPGHKLVDCRVSE